MDYDGNTPIMDCPRVVALRVPTGTLSLAPSFLPTLHSSLAPSHIDSVLSLTHSRTLDQRSPEDPE